ncbi:MAG: GGDEF domain-containing protein [Alteromonadales bacterium]|nr:GGDEF domain-containing protein [Alteromonadales bacterium]
MLIKNQKLLSWNERMTGRALVQLIVMQESYLTTLMQHQQHELANEVLLTQFDLTWSAYETLLKGTKNAYFMKDARRVNKLESYFELFKKSDPLQVKLTGDKLTQTLHNLHQEHIYAVNLLHYEFQGVAQKNHKRDIALVDINRITVISLIGVIISGSLFLFIIINGRIRMAYLAYHDPLTKLNNRRGLQEKITLLQARTLNFSALLIDIDRFKLINDNYGHDTGDKLLIHITQKMSVLCGKDCFLGRLGGDEFAIVCLSKYSIEQMALNL